MANRSMGEIISALRREKGMTQRELADMLNITDKAV
ncbi:MAG: helix-turn-helix transcriptional regulator, partial [Clostridia bacterium]|nr:helix-turn-helix transcriptional regulator [Clostridia bacterium]